MVADIRKYLVSEDKTNGTSEMSQTLNEAIVTDVRLKKKGYINPVLVTFQNGEIKNDQTSNVNVELTANESGRTSVEVETFYGQVFKESNCDPNRGLRQIIAIRNRKTNKVKLIEVDSAILINSVFTKSEETKTSEVNYSKEMQTLKRTFGEKRIVSKLERREKLNINSNLVEDTVKETAADITVEEVIPSMNTDETESVIFLLPPCNRNTKNLSEVYVLSNILSEDEMNKLREEVENPKSGIMDSDSKKYSPFIVKCFEEAKKSDIGLNDRLAGILYADLLCKFIKTPAKKIGIRKQSLCSFSTLIHTKIVNEFCLKTDRSLTRPLTMRDKSLCYIIAICLACCNYRINLKELATTTSVHFSRLTRLARFVGAQPESKDETVYVLKIPLPAMPKPSGGKIRRK